MKDFTIIEKLALKLRNKIFNNYPEISSTKELVDKTVTALGGEIIGMDDPRYKEIYGMLHIINKGTFIIKLDPYSSPIRDTFEVAKEMGRYLFLYKDEMGEKSLFFKDYNSEIVLNRFAASFLMPKKEIKKARKKYNNNLNLIAAHFQIPTDIVNERLKCIH